MLTLSVLLAVLTLIDWFNILFMICVVDSVNDNIDYAIARLCDCSIDTCINSVIRWTHK